jgi:Cu+-exporting ATPase
MSDKTGTITEGKPKIAGILSFGGFAEEDILQLAASAEKGSEHSLGSTVVAESQERYVSCLGRDICRHYCCGRCSECVLRRSHEKLQ